MPIIGEIRMFAGHRLPMGWLPCDGSRQAVRSDDLLFRVIGTTYGGDGVTTYCLPDLRGRLPLGAGQGPGLGRYPIGQSSGMAKVPLTASQLPPHTHILMATNAAPTSASPEDGASLAQPNTTAKPYNDISLAAGGMANFAPGAIGNNASRQDPIDNLMPSYGIRFIIAYEGQFPVQS